MIVFIIGASDSGNSAVRHYIALEKKQIVEETYSPGSGVSYVARKHGIPPSVLYNWRRVMEDGALAGVGCEDEVVSKKEIKKLQSRIRDRVHSILRSFLFSIARER